MSNSFKPTLERLCLSDLLKKPLNIPEYQRHYTWERTHVLDLLKDIFDRETPYLMGTVILHDTFSVDFKDTFNINSLCEKEKSLLFELFDLEYPRDYLFPNTRRLMNIVDGQQRLVTLTILLWELGIGKEKPSSLLEAKFSKNSERSILKSRDVIRDFLKAKPDEEKEKLCNRLHPRVGCNQKDGWLRFTVLTLKGENALDRAFTFFDSINSKGMPLTDFNLLKAHHLMFIPPKQEALASSHNRDWEKRNESHADIFSAVLRRLRMWSRGEDRDSRRERPDYNEFCSVVEPEHGKSGEHELNRYMQPVAFRSWRRVGDRIVLSMDYPSLEGEALVPTEINQTIEGGDPFFIYAKRYHQLYKKLFGISTKRVSTEIDFLRGLSESITNFYLRNAFRAIMLLYVDKFGEDRLIEASVCTERIISDWRWKTTRVRIEGTLSHIRDNRLVPILLDSVNSLHAYSQLFGICQKLAAVNKGVLPEAGVKRDYYDSIKKFYTSELGKTPDIRAQDIIRSHYEVGN